MAKVNKRLVIVGGGFAGVHVGRYLQKRMPSEWEIILFSQENHFIFTPLLGDVVGSSINPVHVVWPIRQMIERVTCRTAALTGLDLAGKAVLYQATDARVERQPYDHLILACGSIVNLDIIPGMAAHGWPFKTMGDALLLRNHLIGLLEKAEVEPDPALRQRLLSIVVVGGGFSGVEVTGEVYDLLLESRRFYHTLKTTTIRVTLLEARERILPELPESLASFAFSKMTRHGITIRVNALARSVTATGIHLKDGTHIDAGTVICTIGTTASPFVAASGLPLRFNRIQTGADMRVPGHDGVWALGDCASVPNAFDQKPAAPTAQVALRQARRLADNLLATIHGQPTRPFFYKPLGMLASIGNRRAVGQMFGVKVSGFPAWFLWRGIYLFKMPTLARKIQIAFDWAWQLFFPRDIVQLSLGATERLGRAHFDAGQFVFHKGEPGEKFYIIERGRAGVYLDEAGPATLTLGPGAYFGEGALLRPVPRSASVRAEEPLDVLVVGRHSFSELVGNLEILRGPLERSMTGNRSSALLLERARDDPRLDTMRVADVMSKPVETLPVALSFDTALHRAQELRRGAYPVVDERGDMVGLCTRTDFYNALQRLCPPETPLADIMHHPVTTVRTSASLTAALLLFLRQPIKRLVVVTDHEPARPVGMITPFDIARALAPR